MKVQIPKEQNGYKVAMGSPGSWNGKCVGVKITADTVSILDTKKADSPVLKFDHKEWEIFIAGVKNNEFDVKEKSGAFRTTF